MDGSRTLAGSRSRIALVVILPALLTVACGPGTGGDSQPLGGIDGGGFSKGAITGFGSVIVNGVTFSTTNAAFTIDGRPGTQADLQVGDVVSVVGNINGTAGEASSVTFDDDVEGPVESVDAASGTLVVMGQTVRVDGNTSFDGSVAGCALGTLQVGRIVEVSGFRAAAGELLASRIECKAAGGELEVTGEVRAHNANQHRLRIAGLVIDYSQAQLQGFPAGGPENGQTVEAKGASITGGVLAATRVELKDPQIPGTDGTHVELEGLVTRFAAPGDFDVSGRRVSVSAATRIRKCSVPLNLAINSFVEVEGTLIGGTIDATDIECRTGSSLRLSGTVLGVDAVAGAVDVLGATVLVDSGTRLEDKSAAKLRDFRLADLRVGDFVEVRGAAGSAPDTLVAARLERDDPRSEVEIRGSVGMIAPPALTVFGIAISTTAGTRFRDRGATISAAVFFARAAGAEVEVRGEVLNDSLVADEIELQD